MKYITNRNIGYNGRLGNQLFQFASLYGIAKQSNKKLILPAANLQRREEGFADGKTRTVGLDLVNVFPKLEKFLSNENLNFMTVHEPAFGFCPSIIEQAQRDFNINFEGWFQGWDYFKDYADELRDILSFEEKASPIDCVSVHIRRSDYLNLPSFHHNLPITYFKEAMEMFKGSKFLIFSDDIEWCKENFPSDKCYFSEGGSEKSDLMKMSLCKHHIIANSTFSWWGAFLNKSKSKKIIAPLQWFSWNNGHMDTSGLTSIASIRV